jgi:superkiller protein 3
LVAQGREADGISAWISADDVSQDLIQRANLAAGSGKYQEALLWCERAIAVDPALGDSWYCAGAALEGLEHWNRAVEAYEQALETECFEEVGQSNPHYRLGTIYERRFDPPQPAAALAAYSAAIAREDFTTDWEAADAYQSRGAIYDRQGNDPAKALTEYERAIGLDPTHHWARLRRGHALYRAHGSVSEAEGEIEKALAVWPEKQSRKWPYRVLGDICRDAGLTEEAIAAYQEALRIDPGDEWVERALKDLANSADE